MSEGMRLVTQNQNRLLSVTFTVPKNNWRVILARPMNKRERKNYALDQT
jgi:uncharacterized DUF497 family protein